MVPRAAHQASSSAEREATILRTPEYALPIPNSCLGGGLDAPSSCFLEAPPSADNPYPSLVTVVGTDVTIADLSIRVVGDYGTEPYELIPGWNLNFIMGVVQVLGSDVSLEIKRAEIDAGPALLFDPHTNTWAGGANSAIGTMFFSQPWTLSNVTLVVADSIIRGLSTVMIGCILEHSRVFFGRNLVIGPIGFSDLLDTQVMFEGNDIRVPAESLLGEAGVYLYSGVLGSGVVDSSLWFANNLFSGGFAILADPGTFHDVECQAVNNDVSGVATPYVWNDNACKVVADK